MNVFAHETWFLEHGFEPDWGFAGERATLILLAVGSPWSSRSAKNHSVALNGMPTELVGHLPVYGAMLALLALLVFGSDPQLREDVGGLWPARSDRREPVAVAA